MRFRIILHAPKALRTPIYLSAPTEAVAREMASELWPDSRDDISLEQAILEHQEKEP